MVEKVADDFKEFALAQGADPDEVDAFVQLLETGPSAAPTPVQQAAPERKRNLIDLDPVPQFDDIVEPRKPKNLADVSVKPTKQQVVQEPRAAQPSTEQAPAVLPQGSIRVTQQFGNPNARLYGYSQSGAANINRGTDLSAAPGEVQFAPAKGKWVVEKAVENNGWNTGWGNYVVLRNPETGETLQHSHLQDVKVKPGQEVTGGALGTTGRTGRTTGYHKDIEYTQNGRLADVTRSPYADYYLNPQKYYKPGVKPTK